MYTENGQDDRNDYQSSRTFITLVIGLVEFLIGVVIYLCIRCCCPTNLKRVRPGMVLSNQPTIGVALQPVMGQNVPMPPPVQMNTYTSPPPRYSTVSEQSDVACHNPTESKPGR